MYYYHHRSPSLIIILHITLLITVLTSLSLTITLTIPLSDLVDVAARGLDLPEVDWILQYDPPCETTDVSSASTYYGIQREGWCFVLFVQSA